MSASRPSRSPFMRLVPLAALTMLLGLARVCAAATPPPFERQWGTFGSAPGQFNWPRGIAADTTGCVYVCDSGNDRVEKFAPDGTFLRSWGGYGTGPGELKQCAGIAA